MCGVVLVLDESERVGILSEEAPKLRNIRTWGHDEPGTEALGSGSIILARASPAHNSMNAD